MKVKDKNGITKVELKYMTTEQNNVIFGWAKKEMNDTNT